MSLVRSPVLSPVRSVVSAVTGGSGPAYGPELVVNGTFDTDLTGWANTAVNLTPTWVSGEAQLSRSGGISPNDCFGQTVTVEIGAQYEIKVSASASTAAWQVRDGTQSLVSAQGLNAGENTVTVTPAGANMILNFWVSNGQTADIDNISVRKVL
ncbi:MAG: hypothetical protein AAGF20_00150 [Pseudomonadota bacterium]